MNMKNPTVAAALGIAAFLNHGVGADPKLTPLPAPPTVTSPWIATNNDVFGNWKTENGDSGYEIKFSPDHTLAVFDEGYGAIGPFVSMWKLVNNHVMIAKTYQYQGPGSEDVHYKAPPISAGYGSDLQVIRVNGHTVLMPSNNAVSAQKIGYAPVCCFWHYTVQHGIDTLPQDAIDLNKAVYKLARYEERKHKQN